MIDTPGLDDEGALGAQRVKKSLQVLRKTDCALLVLDGTVIKSSEYHLSEVELELIQNVEDRKIPFFHELWFSFHEGKTAVSFNKNTGKPTKPL